MNPLRDFAKIEKVFESCTNIEMIFVISDWAYDYIDNNYTGQAEILYNDKVRIMRKNAITKLRQNENIVMAR